MSVNIDINDDEKSVKDILNTYQLTMPTITDTGGKLAKEFELIGTPMHILINREGKLVHRGHDADDQLDTRLALLGTKTPGQLPEILLQYNNKDSVGHKVAAKGLSLLYFSSTWCDWYLKESRPMQSENCQTGQQLFNQLTKQYSTVPALGIHSRLWTTSKELNAYQKKYQVHHELAIDASNNGFIGYQISTLPTLLVIQDGKEVARVTDFTDMATLSQKVSPWLQ